MMDAEATVTIEGATCDEDQPEDQPKVRPLRTLDRVGLVVVVLLAASLRLVWLDQSGFGNPYYAAAARSMQAGVSNYFFGAFDPLGLVTVDKPPVALWLQAASARIFGYRGLSLIVPQALLGIGSVLLTYHLVRRRFGSVAGLLSGLFLAITPIGVAVDRTNLPDPALVFVLLLAAWAVSLAIETGRGRHLMLAAVLVGIGFNVKMLAAFVVLPTFYLCYFLGAPLPVATKLRQLTAATLLLVAVSLSWAAVVEATPKNHRPYIGGSRTNSAFDLALGYNGLGRIIGGLGNFTPGRGRGPGNGGPPARAARFRVRVPSLRRLRVLPHRRSAQAARSGEAECLR